MNIPLYTLKDQYMALQDIDMPDEDLADSLEGLIGEIEIKAENIVHVLSNMDTSALDNEIKRLTEMKRAINNRATNLREYLRFNMDACGISNIKWDTGSIALRKPTKQVLIINPDLMPAKYLKVVSTPIKAAIAKALKNGDDVPGAELVDGNQGLLIK